MCLLKMKSPIHLSENMMLYFYLSVDEMLQEKQLS